MKKITIACVIMILVLSFGNSFAGAKAGLSGLSLFLDLQIGSGKSTKYFYDIVDFDELIRMSDNRGSAKRICREKIGGFDYLFWIETGRAPLKESFFFRTFNRSQNNANKIGGSGDISAERVRGNKERHIDVVAGQNPEFYANIWGNENIDLISKYHELKYYSSLHCKYEK